MMNRTNLAIALLGAALLAGCVTPYSLVEPKPQTVGQVVSVEPAMKWNKMGASGYKGKVEMARAFTLVWSGPGIATFTATSHRPIVADEPTLVEIWVCADGYWTVGSRVYQPQELATAAAFRQMPEEVWRWYLYRLGVCRRAGPNPGHHAVAEAEPLVREHVQSLLGDANVSDELVRWMLWESAGSPLNIRRVIDYLIAHDYLQWRPSGWIADMDRIRALRIPIGVTLSSPTYRARQTVKIAALANAEYVAELGDAGQSMVADTEGSRSAWLRRKAGEAPVAGTATADLRYLGPGRTLVLGGVPGRPDVAMHGAMGFQAACFGNHDHEAPEVVVAALASLALALESFPIAEGGWTSVRRCPLRGGVGRPAAADVRHLVPAAATAVTCFLAASFGRNGERLPTLGKARLVCNFGHH